MPEPRPLSVSIWTTRGETRSTTSTNWSWRAAAGSDSETAATGPVESFPPHPASPRHASHARSTDRRGVTHQRARARIESGRRSTVGRANGRYRLARREGTELLDRGHQRGGEENGR